MLLCSKTGKVKAIKINSQELYIDSLFEDGHSTSLFGHFTNKRIEPVIRYIKVYRLTSRMETFVKKSK